MSDGSDGSRSLAEASTVLVVAPDVRDAPVSACAGLISNGGTRFDRVVGVTVGRSPADWLDARERTTGSTTASLTCVDVDSVTRSAAVEPGKDRPAATLRTVPEASDLEVLGETLSEIMADADAIDDSVAVCLHSLSDLLGRVDERRAFDFLCTLGNRAREYGGVVYAHVDPSAHDERTVELFSAISDAVVEFDGNLEMRVR